MSSSESSIETQNRSENTVLEVRDLSVTYDMERGVSRVLNQVSIDLYPNEILGVVGESGSGKSMFASALLNAVPDPGTVSGEITYYPSDHAPVDVLQLNEDELRRLRWEEISMVFQGAMSSFNPTLRVKTHFKETLKSHDWDIEEGMEEAREILRDLHLDPDRILRSYPHELSGGMKQRTLIALSLILEPNVLVMDEPTAALDLLMQRSILSLIKDIQEKYDVSVVFITHDLPLVAGLADRLAVMYAFEFVEVGSSEEILETATHPYTRALLNAVPNLDIPLSQMRPIEGSSPDPVNIPRGCSYHPRCPLATEMCTTDSPRLEEVEQDREVACFHWEDAAEAIPFSSPDDDIAVDDSEITQQDRQSETPMISVRDLSVHFEESGNPLNPFSNPDTVRAVDNIDLDIYDNDILALVGESGCGKTTLGKAIIGAERPTSGSITYHGQDIWDAKDSINITEPSYEEIRRSLQMIHQDPGGSLNPNRTVEAVLEVPLKRWFTEISSSERQTVVYGMLDHVGMTPPEDYAERYPHQLSGGEKQRIALIRALLVNPSLILADEAISALDVSLRVEMMDLLLDLQQNFDTSYLFISHNLANARYLTGKGDGRIAVMYMGEIVEIGPPEQIINEPKHPYTKVLKWATADLDAEDDTEEPPIRSIDIPDSTNPPSGCRFHTRCPEARETCVKQVPSFDAQSEDEQHLAACFRTAPEDHPYWGSEPIEDGESSTGLSD